jgi:hypothetical protein
VLSTNPTLEAQLTLASAKADVPKNKAAAKIIFFILAPEKLEFEPS